MFPGNQMLAFLQMRTAELFSEDFAHNRAQYRLYQMERRRNMRPQTPLRQPMRMTPVAPRRPRPEPVQTYTIPVNLFTEEPLNNTLNTLLASALLGTQGLADMLTPVEVAPSPQQIAAATIVSSLEPPADVTCAICQDHAQEGTDWRIIRHCGHRFHRSCIDEWFRQNVHCPVCRHDIREV
jgi:hypothetical protein